MAMGGVANKHMYLDAKIKKARSPLIDISANIAFNGAATIPIVELFDPNRACAIVAARCVYSATGTGTGTLSIGTCTMTTGATVSATNIVNAATVGTSANAANSIQELTIASTRKTGNQQHHGGAYVPKTEGVFATVSGGSGAGDYWIEVDYVDIDGSPA